MRMSSRSGKIKRVGRESRVRFVPCARRGEPTGRWTEGEARLVEGEEARRANRLLNEKYGLSNRLVDLFAWVIGDRYVTVAVRM